MVWVGATMTHGYGQVDPALVNPQLAVDMRRPDWEATSVSYWPSYSDITSRQRAAYLAWLAHGRRSPGVPISYVFLFFYGLERRVLDAIDLQTAHTRPGLDELATIRAEIEGLRTVYADEFAADHSGSSFDRYSSSLVDVIDAITAANADTFPSIPEYGPNIWQMPLALKVALGRMARDRVPISADWALAWAWLHPRIYTRTPQRRCRAEFDTLFKLRYTARNGDGLRVRSVKGKVKLDYQGASIVSRYKPIEISALPEVSDQERPVQVLAALAEQVSNDLDAFSRWLGRHPDDKTSLAAIATLPVELVDTTASATLASLVMWASDAVSGRESAVIDSRPALQLWSSPKFGKADAVALANLLQKLGYGIEPDVRCGGPTLVPGPMVLFHAKPDTPHTAGRSYSAATLVAHLGVTVAAADGHVDQAELDQITHQLKSALSLTDGEHQRLAAHIAWLTATGVKLTGLKTRLEPLTTGERETLADFVAAVAAADGVITATESRAVDKIHTLLGLDPTGAARRLHNAITARAANAPVASVVSEPVTIRTATSPAPGYAIPPAPQPDSAMPSYAGRHGRPSEAAVVASSGFVLDEQLIADRRADTATVAALLTRIFDDDPDTPPGDPISTISAATSSQRPDPMKSVTADGPAPLDAGHRELLDALAERNSWYRVEFDKLAAANHLDPDEALTALNQASVAASGRALISGVERLTVDAEAHPHLQAAQTRAPEMHGAVAPTAPQAAVAGVSSGTARPGGTFHAGLDAAHSALLDALAPQTTWFRVQFEALAADNGLLPDAALELLNNAALDVCDDLLLDGAERLTVNQYALTEMLE